MECLLFEFIYVFCCCCNFFDFFGHIEHINRWSSIKEKSFLSLVRAHSNAESNVSRLGEKEDENVFTLFDYIYDDNYIHQNALFV